MIVIDTTVLVRYIMQDDAKQAAKATKLVEGLTAEEPGFITLVSVVELVWSCPRFMTWTAKFVCRGLRSCNVPLLGPARAN